MGDNRNYPDTQKNPEKAPRWSPKLPPNGPQTQIWANLDEGSGPLVQISPEKPRRPDLKFNSKMHTILFFKGQFFEKLIFKVEL